jgi:ATP-dependent DNA ligase
MSHETTLYLKDEKGRVRFWKIFRSKREEDCFYIHHSYGLLNGKVTNPIPHKICGINAEKRAITKINAEIKKKKLLGFQEELKKSVTRGSVFGPMGAHKLDDFEHKLVYPVMVQRKLDGFRCIAHFDENGKVTLYSKSMKPFVHLQHIKKELEEKFHLQNSYLDGELYSHGLKLNEISSLVMKKRELSSEEVEDSKKIVYMVFDYIVENIPFDQRYKSLKSLFKKSKYIQLVECVIAKNKSEVYKLNDQFLLEGYEGVIVRNKSGLYVFKKKSYDVLRTKEFKHGIFTIINGKEGSGTYSGTLIWELKCNKSNSHKSFNAIQMGLLSERKKIFNNFQKNPNDFIGKKVKVKYLMIDDYGCVLRNPIVENIIDK